MQRIFTLLVVACSLWLLAGCNKKANPAKTTVSTPKKNIAAKPKVGTPKVIVIADSAAHRTFDGRYYYDLLGHRYWRNNKDGKYYLYNKSMATDPAFKNP